MKIVFLKQVIILALLVFFLGMIHLWDLPKNISIPHSMREPSSIEPIGVAIGLNESVVEKTNDVETREFDCENLTELYVKNLAVRLEGNCVYHLESITNRTNGYTANIFNKSKVFTTDYISLSSGKNEIEISYKDNKNQDIVRQLPIIVIK